MNIKTLGIIICSAFSVGLVAETAVAIWSLVHGQEVGIHTAVELTVAWLVVLAVFVGTMLSKLGWSSPRSRVETATDDDDDGCYDDGDDSEDCSDPEEDTPEETGTPEHHEDDTTWD